MTMFHFYRRSAAVAIALLMALVLTAGGALAQQPNSVNPTASSVNEQKLLDALKPAAGSTSAIHGRVSIPDQNSRNLIQPAGQDWRAFHEGTLPRVGMLSIFGMLTLLTLFLLIRGRIRISNGFSGTMIERFGGVERFAHWLTAISFLVLGLTGLNLTFGKSLLLPLIGPEAFTALTQLGKFVHNYVSFAFALGLVLMFVLWVKDNIPHPRDLLWIVQGGGLFGKFHPAAARFNFGQKLIFWSVILGGAGLSVTGYVMMFPFRFTDIGGMQFASVVHGLLGVVLVAIIIAHIYIGSVGMEGAFGAMGTGQVDLNWAKDHHSIWVERVTAKSPEKITGLRRSPAPAE